MTRPWTLAESRTIAERVMEWQVFEFNGRLWLTDPTQRPTWLWDCSIPDWLNDPAAASMALAEWCKDTGSTSWIYWVPSRRVFEVALQHPTDMRKRVIADAREWSEAVMLAILAAVEV
jgi:hypothetical protein